MTFHHKIFKTVFHIKKAVVCINSTDILHKCLNLVNHIRNTMNLKLSKTVQLHLLYWLMLMVFFTLIWGSYDNDYGRNFMVQLWSLPARLLLVYGTILFLIPKILLKEKYLSFIVGFLVLFLFSGVIIHRSIMVFIVQGRYLPYESKSFFKLTELMNTALDVNLALIVPVVYVFFQIWKKAQQKNEELAQNLQQVTQQETQFIYLKEGNSRHKVFIKDIIFIESLKNYIKVKTTHTEITAYKSISAMQEILPEAKFLRVHRSFIIAIDHISTFSPTKIQLGDINIPVGRKYKEDVKNRLNYA